MININDKQKMLLKSYKLVKSIMKERSVSFYQAFMTLPKERFLGVAAIYAFCRYVDDLVDCISSSQEKTTTLELLDKLENELRSLYANEKDMKFTEVEGYLWWLAFADTIRKFNIPIDSFLQQIEGQRRDVDFVDIKTVEELIEYSKLVAGSVGTMMLPIIAADGIDIKNVEFIRACENLGVGMQITNILRDIGEDLQTRNRLYIPAELMEKYGVQKVVLEKLSITPGMEISKEVIAIWEELAQLADTYYADYENWLSWFHPKSQIPLVAAALVYQAIADEVRAENYNCFTKRCYTSAINRARLIIEAKKRVGEKTKIKY